MTITLDIGAGKPYANITSALATITTWDDDVLLQVHSDIIDSVNFGHITESTNNLTIEGIGTTKPIWSNYISHNFTSVNECHLVLKNLEIRHTGSARCLHLPKARDVTIDSCLLNQVSPGSYLAYIDGGVGDSCNAILTNNIILSGIHLGGTYKSFWKLQNNTWYVVDPEAMLRIAHTSTNPTLIVQNNIFAMDSTLVTANFVNMNYFPFGTWSNNIWYNFQTSPAIWTIASTVHSFSSWSSAVSETSSSWVDPMFTAAPSDFSILDGSPAQDTGLNLVPHDYNHIRRPREANSEIGALEFIVPRLDAEVLLHIAPDNDLLNLVTRIGYFN